MTYKSVVVDTQTVSTGVAWVPHQAHHNLVLLADGCFVLMHVVMSRCIHMHHVPVAGQIHDSITRLVMFTGDPLATGHQRLIPVQLHMAYR